jgi:hypothetical protein
MRLNRHSHRISYSLAPLSRQAPGNLPPIVGEWEAIFEGSSYYGGYSEWNLGTRKGLGDVSTPTLLPLPPQLTR